MQWKEVLKRQLAQIEKIGVYDRETWGVGQNSKVSGGRARQRAG